MAQRDRLGQRLVQAERRGQRARDLRDLQRVRQARDEVVALGVDEDLRLVLQAAERLGVEDPVTVTLEGGPELVRWLGLDPATRRLGAHGRRREALLFSLPRDAVAPHKPATDGHGLHGAMMRVTEVGRQQA